jgi:hypothetical protein
MHPCTEGSDMPLLEDEDLRLLRSLSIDQYLFKAARELQALKMRELNPDGKFDGAGRFYLQKHPCCDRIRAPSRAYPYSQMHHGRTARHVAMKHRMPEREKDVRKLARLLEKYKGLRYSAKTSLAVVARATAQEVLLSFAAAPPIDAPVL